MNFSKNENYHFPMRRYISPSRFQRVKEFSKNIETPFLVVDLDTIKKKYKALEKQLPFASIYYAVKANPMEEVLLLLKKLGSNFDVATRFELDQLLKLGVSPDRISYGNTIKKEADIKYFHERGVSLFATDCEEDLHKIARNAPGAKVIFRLLAEGTGADWPLSRKFGSHPDMIYNLVLLAVKLQLEPFGISFHVGSQQRDIGQWDSSISVCTYLFNALKRDHGISLKVINLGGGFPGSYLHPSPKLEKYTSAITKFLQDDFGDDIPKIFIEPGRSMVADAGVIVSEVIMTSHKSDFSPYKWVYLDIGKFGGMIETIEESIKYPILTDKEGLAEEVILAGPTCDSMDVLYETYKYTLPDTLRPGDRVYILTTGAYTQSYSSLNFNGFPPLKSYILH